MNPSRAGRAQDFPVVIAIDTPAVVAIEIEVHASDGRTWRGRLSQANQLIGTLAS